MYSNRSKEAQEVIEYVIDKYKSKIDHIDLINMSRLFDDSQVLVGDYEQFVLAYYDISSIKLEETD